MVGFIKLVNTNILFVSGAFPIFFDVLVVLSFKEGVDEA
jgi:hypothetical protein